MYNNLYTTSVCVDTNDNRSYTHNLFKQSSNLSQKEKNSGLNRISIDDLCAVLYHLGLSN